MSASAIDAGRRLADHAGVAFVTLEPTPGAEDTYRPVDAGARSLLTAELCRELEMLPIALEGDVVLIAAAEPVQYLPYDVAAALAGRPVSFVLTPPDQLARALAHEPSSSSSQPTAPSPQGLGR